MWEYQEWHCMHCGYILKFGVDRTDVDTWCERCHEPMDKLREVRNEEV